MRAHHSYAVLAQRFIEALCHEYGRAKRPQWPSAMRGARIRAATACCGPTSGRPCRSGSAPCSACSRRLAWHDLSRLRLLEVGCGAGGNLLELLRLGFAPAHLSGIELLPERLAAARAALPEAVALSGGDALDAPVPEQSLDIVFVSTVFSSLLDDAYQQRLAEAMWDWLKPGGAVLWYDFTVDNPRNPDVRGVPLARLRALFPQGRLRHRRVTLAPPLARAVTRIHPACTAGSMRCRCCAPMCWSGSTSLDTGAVT